MTNEVLKEALRRKGLEVNTKELNFFFAKPTQMKNEDRTMWRPDLLTKIRKFSHTFHGKDPEKKLTEQIADKIKETFEQLSVTEVDYCLNRILEGDEEIQREFVLQAGSILKVIKQYNGRKKFIAKTYFDLIKADKDSEQSKQNYHIFVQGALKKHSDKLHLTIYERSALGNHFAIKADKKQVEQFKRDANANLTIAQTDLSKRRNAAFGIMMEDPEQNLPIMWTERLLFGSTFYDALYANK